MLRQNQKILLNLILLGLTFLIVLKVFGPVSLKSISEPFGSTYISESPELLQAPEEPTSETNSPVLLNKVPDPDLPLTADQVFLGGKSLEQDDPRLLSFIRAFHLFPPSPNPYQLKSPDGDPSAQMGIRKLVHGLLGNIKNGFFIECGGLDGEFYSNSLVLERDYGWRGLLVEADPDYVPKLKATHRKAWFADVCLSLNPWPEMVKMQAHGIMGWSVISNTTIPNFHSVDVKCIPIFSILSALQVSTVDYFSLDIEGNELKVLQTIPFDKIFIKAFSIETSPESSALIKPFMLSKGYEFITKITNPGAHDDIYLHSSLANKDKPDKT